MTPTELATRLKQMDWSGCSLQHQLAIACAVETLTHLEKEPSMPAAANSNVRTRWISITTLDGHRWATSSHFSPGGAWSWIAESVAAELAVDEDAVGCIEDPEGGDDLVTVDGLPAYRIEHWSSPSSI